MSETKDRLPASRLIYPDDEFIAAFQARIEAQKRDKKPEEPPTYTVAQVSEKRYLSEYVIRRHIREGKLEAHKEPGGKSWIITEEAMNDYLNIKKQN